LANEVGYFGSDFGLHRLRQCLAVQQSRRHAKLL
jgi:hypothetical protein